MGQGNFTMDRTGPQQGLFRSIRTKFIFSFIVLFLLIMICSEYIEKVGIPFTTFTGELGYEREEAFGSLNLIADMKKERLERWLEERRDDIQVASSNDFTSSVVVEILAMIDKQSGGDISDKKLWNSVRKEKNYIALLKYLDSIRVAYGVYNIIKIADAKTGTIIISTKEKIIGKNVASRSYFTGALQSDDVYVRDIRFAIDHESYPDLHFSRAIKNQNGEAIAVLIADVNVSDMIEPLLSTGGGLGEMGETLLVNKDATILTSIKHLLSNGTRAELLKYQIKAEPAVRAARREEGIIETEDYRGEQVLAAYRYIPVTPEWGWGMVVKRDTAEFFAPLWENMLFSFLGNLIGLLGFIIVAVFLIRNLTRPILALSQTATKVAEGDLDARAPVASSDEVGVLSETFNFMVQSIKERTKELRDAQENLVRKEKLAVLGQLSGGVGHELRNPLGVISNAVYYLKMVQPNPDEKTKEYMDMISAEVITAEKIVSDLLDFSRIKKTEKKNVEVSELISQVLKRQPPPEEIKVSSEIPAKLPPVFVDSQHIQQVLNNLVTNACHAMPDGGNLIIKAQNNSKNVRITVSDTGCGISDEDSKKIFEPLFTTKARGIGLGLSVTRNLVELNEGSIEVKSKVGKGSTFTIHLPIRKA